MKACALCGGIKPLSDFHKQVRAKDGHQTRCKKCAVSCARDYYQRNKPLVRARVRAYKLANPEREREWQRQAGRRLRNRLSWAERTSLDHRAAHVANTRVFRAIRSGQLKRPDACEWCGKCCKPDGAHSDYSRPLLVTWLCRSCHSQWDREQPKARGLAAQF